MGSGELGSKSSNASEDLHTDIIIAGAGATGLALGLAMSKYTNLKVTIVEAGDQISDVNHGNTQSDFLDLRSVALSAHSCQFLNEIGLTSITQLGCQIDHIHVSDKGHLAQSTIHAEDYQMPWLGRVVELPRLTSALYQALKSSLHPLEWLWRTKIASVQRTTDSVSVTLSSGKKIHAKLLVVAEGGDSPTREKLGIDVQRHPYQQSAIVANIELSQSHDNWAFERFTTNGPLAMLPLPGEPAQQNRYRCSLVWTIAQHQTEALMAADKARFLSQLQATFGHRLGAFTGVGDRAWFPLVLSRANQHVHHRAALVGNACQALHPIAGQGLNLALRDVNALINILCGNSGDDPGQYSLLSAYQNDRKVDQSALVTATETLVSTFSNDYFPLVIGRNIALSALDNTPMAKRALAVRAMGFNTNKRAVDATF